MASKLIYRIVAVLGIAAASGAAWWVQARGQAPKEIGSPSGGSAPAKAAPAGTGGAAAGPARPAGVEVAKVETTSLQDDAQAVGTLRSRQSVMLRPEVPGRIKALGFEDGARVRRGQVLVQLDDALQRAEVRQSIAQVSIARANYKRNQDLVAQNFIAQRALDESAASLEVAEAQVSLSCARLARMVIVAPFDGVVGLRNVNVGDFVKDGADLVDLEDISSMLVDFRLPERYQGKLRSQQSVEMALDAFPGRSFKAQVQAIDPLLDANGRSVGVRAVLPNTPGELATAPKAGAPGGPGAAPGASVPKPAEKKSPAPALAAGKPAGQGLGQRLTVEASGCPTPTETSASAAAALKGGPAGPAPLRPGMFARVTTVFSVNDSALTVPEEAIVPQGGRQFVFKVVAPADVAGVDAASLPPETQFVSLRQEVKLGVRRQGKVQISDGLKVGETVVVAGQQRLQKDGTPLKVLETGKPTAPANAGAPAAPAAASGAAPVPGPAPAGAAQAPSR